MAYTEEELKKELEKLDKEIDELETYIQSVISKQ